MPLDYERLDGDLSDHHPDELMPDGIDYIRQAAEAWDVGILPGPGALMDQPAKLVSGIKIWRNMLRRAAMVREQRMGGR